MSGNPVLRVPLSPVERAAWAAIVCLVAPLIRLAAFGEPLWIDELHTGWVVADGLEHLSERARAGNQSPLWFLLPWLTTRLAGNEWMLRLPSLLAGWAVVPATFYVGRRLSGSASGGLLAAFLAAVDPKFAFYSVEARGYSTVHLVTLLHLAAFLPAIAGRSTGKTRAVWIISGAGLFYLHYTTALVLVAELVAWLAVSGWNKRSERGTPRSVRYLMVDFGLLVLACAPACEHLRHVAAHRADWSNVLTPESPWRVFAWDTYVLAPLGMAFTLVVLRWWQQVEPIAWQPARSTVTTVTCWISVPWLLAIVATHLAGAQLLRYRYLMSAAAVFPLVAAIAFSSVTTRGWRTVFAVAIVLAGITGNSTLMTWLRTGTWYAERSENWQAVVAKIANEDPQGALPILLAGGLVEDSRLAPRQSLDDASNQAAAADSDRALIEFCRFPLRSLYRPPQAEQDIWPIASMVVKPRLSAEQQATIVDRRGTWIVVRGSPDWGLRVIADVRRACEVAGHSTSLVSIETYADSLTVARLTIGR